ncbi:MAG: endonuclease [Candidatus Krumholzibacteriota bacterium]|nr:endonuclease [Candidatus Krumholzibacteriota bacterium]
MAGVDRKRRDGENVILKIYTLLLGEYGSQRWWPVTPRGGLRPEYSGGPVDDRQRHEVCYGAILTQNTSWKNASAAIVNMNREGILDPEDILSVDLDKLATTIRPCGYYNSKAVKLKELSRYLIENRGVKRETLLKVKGVGPETADSILLYAFGELFFVVDAYTRRIFSRTGLIDGREAYESVRKYFEHALPPDASLYGEYHALIVEHARRRCLRRTPLCVDCPLISLCRRVMER